MIEKDRFCKQSTWYIRRSYIYIFRNWKYAKFCISLTSVKEGSQMLIVTILRLILGRYLAEESGYYNSMRQNWLWKCSSHWYLISLLTSLAKNSTFLTWKCCTVLWFLLSDTDIKYFVLVLCIWQSLKEKGQSEKRREMSIFERCGLDLYHPK